MKRLPFLVGLIFLLLNLIFNYYYTSEGQMGTVTDKYDVLFRPANYAFAIWGIIYLSLAGWLVYHIAKPDPALKLPAYLSAIVSALGIAWVWTFIHLQIGLTVAIIVGMLINLIICFRFLRSRAFPTADRLPFDLYLGWISVATIANATILLSSLGWHGGALSQIPWTAIMIGVGTALSILLGVRYRNLTIPLVFGWAYFAIYQYLQKSYEPAGTVAMVAAFATPIIVAIFTLRSRRSHKA